mmetsp:Transcript_45832/g.115536  ORF Transcript_45832/g.115536 Transcript_45832/m.115536 type:complete len:254 (-) Transcript_45832:938-1699(-)
MPAVLVEERGNRKLPEATKTGDHVLLANAGVPASQAVSAAATSSRRAARAAAAGVQSVPRVYMMPLVLVEQPSNRDAPESTSNRAGELAADEDEGEATKFVAFSAVALGDVIAKAPLGLVMAPSNRSAALAASGFSTCSSPLPSSALAGGTTTTTAVMSSLCPAGHLARAVSTRCLASCVGFTPSPKPPVICFATSSEVKCSHTPSEATMRTPPGDKATDVRTSGSCDNPMLCATTSPNERLIMMPGYGEPFM